MFNLNTENQKIPIKNASIQLFIKREDLIHPFVSGNKSRKLKYNIESALEIGATSLLTFGGAYSNHIAAVAYAGKYYGLNTIGVIRGEELKAKVDRNHTLAFAKNCGMDFDFISREDYRKKTHECFLNTLKDKYGKFYLIPEGGTNDLAIKGCEEILTETDKTFDYICCCVGTGGTVTGIVNSSDVSQKILGFPALKGDFLKKDICKFANQDNWELVTDYHFGGYAKINSELVAFINEFKRAQNIPLDPIYTGKMMFGVFDLIDKNYFPEDSSILVIHTGGLQGISGMNERLKNKGFPLIEI